MNTVKGHWKAWKYSFCCSVTKSCLTFCDPMDCSMPGFPVLHYLPKVAQIHVHWVSDAIQPSHPLLPPCPPTLNLSQHQGLLQWVGSSHQMARDLELQLHRYEYQGWLPLGLAGLILFQSKGLKSLLQHRSSKASILRHSAFFTVSHIHTWPQEKP